MKLIIFAFLIAFTLANLLVKWYGAPGLWISSALLIPFDFVCRCIIHERLKGARLFLTLSALTVGAALLTVALNWQAKDIALASVCGFTAAQITAGLFYQWRKRNHDSYFIKVNVSDVIAIVFDSIVFQWVAFMAVNPLITTGQMLIKVLGGLLWYWIFFQGPFRKWLQKNITSNPYGFKIHVRKELINELKAKAAPSKVIVITEDMTEKEIEQLIDKTFNNKNDSL